MSISSKQNDLPEWYDRDNSRRIDLINKRFDHGLTHEESIELDSLTLKCRAYCDEKYPLVSVGALALYEELKSKEQDK